MSAKMCSDKNMRTVSCRIHAGGSIGIHKRETGSDINFIISGMGKAVCDGKTNILFRVRARVCKKDRNAAL